MSARCSGALGRKSPAKARAVTSSEDGNLSSSSQDVGAGSGTGSLHGRLLVGRKILKRLGDDTVMSGHVREYNPPTEGKEGSWTLRYENPHAEEGDDENNSYDHEHVNRAELDKLLNLQKVREREFPQTTPSKKGRGRPRKDASKSKPNSKSKSKTSPSRSRSAPTATASPKRSAGGGGGSKKRSASPSASSSASSTPVTPPPRKKKSAANDDSGKLRGNKADVGKRIAREFTEGVFTGEVVEVEQTGARGVLWKIDYEDGDREDLNEEEMNRFVLLHKLLSDKFAEANGHAVTAADLAAEDLEEDDDDLDLSQSQGTPKGKGKGKGKSRGLSAEEKQVGAGVRKFFDAYDEFYDGKVMKYFPPESDDEHEDLWLINYEDGDAEHLDSDELAKARAEYNERYALVKKRVALPTNAFFAGNPATNFSKKATKITLYGETPVGTRGIFSTIKGYRRFKSMHPST